MLTNRSARFACAVLMIAAVVAFSFGCAGQKEPEWKAVNDKVMEEHGLSFTPRADVPETGVTPSLIAGKVTSLTTFPEVEFAPGVTGTMYWGHGNLANFMTLEPNAEIPRETLESERVMVVLEGSLEQLVGDSYVPMKAIPRTPIHGTNGISPSREFIYLEKGMTNGVKAGPDGAKFVEVYWPVRLDYLKKAGATDVPSSVTAGTYAIDPTHEAGKVYDLYDVQLTELVPDADSRLIAGRGTQLSFLNMAPGSVFGHHNHPEEQMMIVLRGEIDEIVMDGTQMMRPNDVLLLPAGMVHGGTNGPNGCDVIDIFWPVRADYTASMEKRLDMYHAIIPEDAEVELVVDGAEEGPGLIFTEGPTWMDGKLYFSSMYFDTDWTGDPGRSATVAMSPDGSYEYIQHGKMQTNGTMTLGNGNLAVCDMFGHRVIEMTPQGKVVRVLASKYDGKSLDGPNDLVVDSKGGIYFTDPQFTPDAEKNQPGRAVYYLTPDRKVIRVIEPNDFAMPNGCILSPDGKILYVNNTYDDESWWNVDSNKDNFIWAYDVNDDGTLSNGRQFGELFLTEDVLERGGKSTSADGLTIDMEGNLYVATQMGIQILDRNGEYIGNINFPVMPVSCCFGGDDMKTLYATCYDRIYRIRTNVTGVTFPVK